MPALDALRILVLLIERAQEAADAEAAIALKAEHAKQRASFEHAIYQIEEAITDAPAGDDLMASIMGDHRTLAEAILDGWE